MRSLEKQKADLEWLIQNKSQVGCFYISKDSQQHYTQQQQSRIKQHLVLIIIFLNLKTHKASVVLLLESPGWELRNRATEVVVRQVPKFQKKKTKLKHKKTKSLKENVTGRGRKDKSLCILTRRWDEGFETKKQGRAQTMSCCSIS